MEKLALSVPEAATASDVSTRTMWKHIREGRIPVVKFGKRTVVPVDSLKEWLAREAAKSAAPVATR